VAVSHRRGNACDLPLLLTQPKCGMLTETWLDPVKNLILSTTGHISWPLVPVWRTSSPRALLSSSIASAMARERSASSAEVQVEDPAEGNHKRDDDDPSGSG
jgi:hypothetical protein